MKQQANKDEGFSLVMSLIFISLLSVLVVGFLTSMRVEVFSSDAHFQAAKAQYYADAGTDMAIGRLKFALTSLTGVIWTTRPGEILTLNSAGAVTSTISLYSGWGSNGDGADIAAELNDGTNYLITNASDRMRIKWIYVHKNGLLEPVGATAPTYSASNPVVGRFAYWVDDESARINLNTAYLHNSTFSQVNLNIFPSIFTVGNDSLVNSLVNYRAGNPAHYFNTVNEVRSLPSAGATMASLITNNRFSLSAANRAPDLNFFGEPRIVLTTQEALAGGRPYLKILGTPNSDPGNQTNLDAGNCASTVASLCAIINRTGWPYASSTSLAAKYNQAGRMIRPQALALNIIDYVRAKETALAQVQLMRGTVTGTNGFALAPEDGGALPGNNRSLRITEYKVELVNGIDGTKNWPGTYTTSTALPLPYTQFDIIRPVIIAEVHLSSYSGLSSVNLNTTTIAATFNILDKTTGQLMPLYWSQSPVYNVPPVPGLLASNVPMTLGTSSATIQYPYVRVPITGAPNAVATSAATMANPYIINAGEYRTIIATMSTVFAMADSTPSGPITAQIRNPRRRSDIGGVNSGIALRDTSDVRVEYAGGGSVYSTTYSMVAGVGVEEPDHSMAVDDPWVNRSLGDWVRQDATKMNFGAAPLVPLNSMAAGTLISTLSAQQDTTAAGLPTNIGCRFPAVAGSTSTPVGAVPNPYGVVESVAELGGVHTGTELNATTGGAGVPYRTFRFQPKSNASTVPDWVLLDMFSVPTKRWVSVSNKSLGVTDMLSYSQPIVGTTSGTLSSTLSSTLSQRLDGQVNLNTTISPRFTIGTTSNILTRSDPLRAVFLGAFNKANMTTTLGSTEASTAATNVAAFTLAATGSRYGMSSIYLTRGEIAEMRGVADGGEESENVLRGVVDQLTTRGSVFRIYSMGQAIVQSPTSNAITVMGEKRMMSLVERAVITITPSSPTTTTTSFKMLYSGKPQ